MTDTGAVGAREFGSARMKMQPLADADAPLYARIYGDAELMRFVAAPLSGAALQRSFNAALESTRARNFRGRYWRMVERAGGQDIGILGLSRAAADAGGGAELGCMLSRSKLCRAWWRCTCLRMQRPLPSWPASDSSASRRSRGRFIRRAGR